MNKICNQILNEIKPKEEQESFVKKETSSFLKSLNKKLKNAKAVVGGSFEKNTWVAGNYDVDIFVKFYYDKYKNIDISKELEKSLKGVKKTKIHGSRDYFQIKHGKFNFEVVPVLNIKDYKQAMNVTDISPLHSMFINNNSSKKIQDEIRIAKQFLRSNELYGAESHIRGFSGYLIELLIIYYKGFENFIKNASKWKEQEIIDIKKHYKSKTDLLLSLNASKLGPLIVIDPMQKNRNVGAALSMEKYDLIKNIARKYMKKPSMDYFKIKEFDIAKYKNSIMIEIIPKKGKADIIGSKIYKLFEIMKFRIDEEGFTLNNSGWHYDKKTYLWFIPKEMEIDKLKKHYGPFIEDYENIRKFKLKWQGYKLYEEKKKSYVIIERKFYRINDLISILIKDKSINKYVKSIKRL